MASLRDDYWTTENINLLVEKRIANDAIFKQTNSDRIGWLQVVVDMKKEGGSNLLNRVNTRKQWFKTCENYKNSLTQPEDKKQELLELPYYAKLQKFFSKIAAPAKKSKCLNQGYVNKLRTRILSPSSYSDRWTTDKTLGLINARINRHSMFQGRGHSAVAWRQIAQDFDSTAMSVAQVKKKWENLVTKYKNLVHSGRRHSNWPYFEKMDHFFNKVQQNTTPKKDHVNFSAGPLSDKWSVDRTYLLINRRIARDSLFGRGKSTSGWQAVLTDLINSGAPKDLTIAEVKKKWENLLTRHKIIKDLGTENTKWHYFLQMEKYHKVKKNGRRSKKKNNVEPETLENDTTKNNVETVTLENDTDKNNSEHVTLENDIDEENFENIAEESSIIIIDEKLSKCRLCQKEEGYHSLSGDKDLCEQIVKCTSINVCEDNDLLPSLICDYCKDKIENFYKFLIVCKDVDKELKTRLEQVVEIKSENFIETLETKEEDNENLEEKITMQIQNRKTLECPECPASFRKTETFETHLKSHKTGSAKFLCDICNMHFMKQSALFAHIQEHFEITNMETVEMDKNLEIQYIDIEGDSTDFVISEEVYHCEICSENFVSSQSLKEHFHTHSKIEHRCPREDCNKTFSSMYSLRQHEMRHQGLNTFLCTACAKGFVNSAALKMHEKIHSEVKDHICEICSRGFSVLSNLKSHQKKHHEGHRYYCSKCPKEFLTKSSLQRHELVHTGVKEFVCDTCSSAFFTIKELNKHKRYHEGTKLYHCNECYKTFYEKHHLTIHNRSHTGERPYVCKINGCKKAFKEKQKLNRHERSTHLLK